MQTQKKSILAILFVVCLSLMPLITRTNNYCEYKHHHFQVDSDEFLNSDHLLSLNFAEDSYKLTALPGIKETFPRVSSITQNSIYPNVSVIVNSMLYTNTTIQARIATYMDDLEIMGYNPLLYTSPISDEVALRTLLQEYYQNSSIEGAVLIGELPYAEFYDPDPGDFGGVFICELFLMDLDGIWNDTNDDSIYDNHYASYPADILPEIYIGRIDASTRTFGDKTETQEIIDFLNRTHAYKLGDPNMLRSNKGLAYVDDTWEAWGWSWGSQMKYAYSDREIIYTPSLATTKGDWSDRLTDDYEFGYVCVHSSPTAHYFEEQGNYNLLYNYQINAIQPAFNYYLLYSCSAADFATQDCLTNTYLFSGPRSLAVISSSKTGGMFETRSFFESFGNNYSIGESFYIWFQDIETYATNYLQWFYGMQIHGDPFSYIEPDSTVVPVEISSSTHPDQSQWYQTTQVQLNWTIPNDQNEIIGYYFSVDQFPSSIPSTNTANFTQYNGTYLDLSSYSGSNYLHVVSIDSLGNIAKQVSHFRINIDNISPIIDFTSISHNSNVSESNFMFNWNVSDSGSGYSNTTIWFDTQSNIVYQGNELSANFVDLTEGTHTINITVSDNLGYSDTLQFNFYVDLTNPIIDIQNDKNGVLKFKSLNEMLQWSSSDEDSSGVAYVEIYLDGINQTTVFAPNNTLKWSNLFSEDSKVRKISLKIVVYDKSGRSSIDEVLVSWSKFSILSFQLKFLFISSVLGLSIILLTFKWKRIKNAFPT
jgi:hypothetical protein